MTTAHDRRPRVCKHPVASLAEAVGCLRRRFREHARFTLVELLVVIAIIAILASMLLASLALARAKGKQADCINNIRQLTVAVELYAGDWDGFFPWSTDGGSGAGEEGGWVYYTNFTQTAGDITDFDVTRGTLYKYVMAEGIYRCPADETESQCSYGLNGDTSNLSAGVPRRQGAVHDPEQTPLFLEEGASAETTNDGFFNIWYTPPDHVVNRHNQGSIYSYCDGHVRWQKLEDQTVYEQCNFLDEPPSPDW